MWLHRSCGECGDLLEFVSRKPKRHGTTGDTRCGFAQAFSPSGCSFCSAITPPGKGGAASLVTPCSPRLSVVSIRCGFFSCLRGRRALDSVFRRSSAQVALRPDPPPCGGDELAKSSSAVSSLSLLSARILLAPSWRLKSSRAPRHSCFPAVSRATMDEADS